MQQIRMCAKQKVLHWWNTFVSIVLSWCTITDVKITLPDYSEVDIKEIRELLDEYVNKKEAPG